MGAPDFFDFRAPDYAAVIKQRAEALERLRADPTDLPLLKAYYRDDPAQFIVDWGVTCDPNNISRGLPVRIPFILFPKQIEWTRWVLQHWNDGTPGITEKSRQSGLSWLLMALSCALCLFYPGLSIGVGSRKEELLDRRGDPKSLFEKGRLFMQNLPAEFRGIWDRDRHSPHMRLIFPETDSIITGEAGDGIGRGATTALFFVDEAAFIERPELVDASLSQGTGCRIDVSTPNGRANSFAERRFSGKIDVFTLSWRDDPRKDEEWYNRQVAQLDPVVIAQELDLDYAGSVDNGLIPSAWIQAAVDAHLKLDIAPTGNRRAALDVADVGKDLNALCGAHGVVVQHLAEWSGKGLDLMATTAKAFNLCDDCEYTELAYDADGLGAGVRGDARTLNASRKSPIKVKPFRGSESPLHPTRQDVPGRDNKDFFSNRKAQGWWALRRRFEVTYKAVTEGGDFEPDDIISLPSGLPLLQKLLAELVQPTYSINTVGKIVIDKAPSGARSPNLADALMICFAPASRPMNITDEMLAQITPDPARRALAW